MATLKVSKHSALEAPAIEVYLAEAALPMRLAVIADDDCPLVASHWFLYEGGRLYGVLHKAAKVARCLQTRPRCGFEIASEEPPYCGVRGQGQARLLSTGAEALLPRLFERYRIQAGSELARWLMGRIDDERVLEIAPNWVSGWDYTERMSDAQN